MVKRPTRFGVIVFVCGMATSLPSILVGTACSSWDAAVGVRCDEYPSFCRAPPSLSNTNDEGGIGTGDGSVIANEDASDGGGSTNTGPAVSFRRDIRPLMNRSETDPTGPGCSLCHYRGTSTGTQMGINEGQLDMTTLGQLRRGGKTSGSQIVVATKPEDSALVQKLRGTYSVGSRMPWNGPPYWSEAEIRLVETWIKQGARGDDDE